MNLRELKDKLKDFDNESDVCVHLGCGIITDIEDVLQDDDGIVYIDFKPVGEYN